MRFDALIIGAVVGNNIEEHPSAAEQRLRHNSRLSRNCFLVSLAFIVLAYFDYEFVYRICDLEWGMGGVALLFILTRIVICFAGIACNIAAIAIGMKGGRKGTLWGVLALIILPITIFSLYNLLWRIPWPKYEGIYGYNICPESANVSTYGESVKDARSGGIEG
jgi:hypothetical protein